MWQYLLILITLAVAVLGIFKKERASCVTRAILVSLLVAAAVIQVIIYHGEVKNRQGAEAAQDRLAQTNDSLLTQNQDLVEKNTELLNRVKEYQAAVASAKATAEAVRDYAYYAKCDGTGRDLTVGFGLIYETEISKMLKPSLNVVDNHFSARCDSASELVYLSVMAAFPNFPFSYYYMAVCMLEAGDPSWRQYALDAVSILKQTTSIEGHHENHDQALTRLKRLLGEG